MKLSSLSIAVLIAVPWLALFMPARLKAVLRLSVINSFILAFAAGYALTLRANTDYNLLSWQRAILSAAGLALLLLTAAILVDKTLRRNRGLALVLSAVAALYGYGAAIETNVLLDRSTPRNIATPVLGFRNTRGGTGYEIDLSPLGPGTAKTNVSVPLEVYSKLQPRQPACVQLKSGALGIPWYQVLPCKINLPPPCRFSKGRTSFP